MNCPCDQLIFPPVRSIPAGLAWVRTQLATYPEFRAAMLAAIPTKAALASWRARETGDFGLMMLDWWAWLADSISFYDEVHTNEFLVRCAAQRDSLRKLVGLLGYQVRPAVAARVELALLLEGRKVIEIPPGTAFRSGSFPGGSPQVFETTQAFSFDPRNNRWPLERKRRATLTASGSGSHARTSILVEPASLRMKKDDAFLLRTGAAGTHADPRIVSAISDSKESDDETYKQIEWENSVAMAGATLLGDIHILKATRRAGMYTHKPGVSTPDIASHANGRTRLLLDRVYGDIVAGNDVMLERNGEFRWFKVYSCNEYTVTVSPASTVEVKDKDGNVTSKVSVPAATMKVSRLILDTKWNNPNRRLPGSPSWSYYEEVGSVVVHYAFISGATPTVPYNAALDPGDSLVLEKPVEKPLSGESPTLFHLEDADGGGQRVEGAIAYGSRTLNLNATTPLTAPLAVPATAYANIIPASRGETVANEVLGAGDARVARQSFRLKKPLTYEAGASAPVSTLTARVNGVVWQEVPTLYGVAADEQVYVVRQDDSGNSTITFNPRLPTGSVVTADYRSGGGALSPPSGSIKQMVRPVPGVRSVKNPVAAYGGADAESPEMLRTNAPRTALLLGRAISLPDMESAAAIVPGVRAAAAEWRWNVQSQRPVVEIYYIGAAALADEIRSSLGELSDGTTPIAVLEATPVNAGLSLSLQIDSNYVDETVLAAVIAKLMDTGAGMLAPERIGIGKPLFRSRLFESILGVEGVVAVDGALRNGAPWLDWGITPGAGKYFDFETYPLTLNGEA